MSEPAAQFLGDPFREQRSWAEGRAFSGLSHCGVIEVVGADAAAFLSSLWSQRLDSLAVGGSAEALLLDPMGHVEEQAAVIRESEQSFVLILEPGRAHRLALWLDSMRFMMRVEVHDVTASFAVIALNAAALFPRVPEPLSVARVVWDDPWRAVVDGGTQYSGENRARSDFRLALAVVQRAQYGRIRAELTATGLTEVGWGAVDSARIEAWRPRLGAEGDERLLPHEVDWLRTAVHLAKGCYRGQETVAKVHNLGHPPRRLVFLHLDGSDDVLPVHGDAVYVGMEVDGTDERSPVGVVTSSARHWQLGPIALALVKRTVPVDAELVAVRDGVQVAAHQEQIVPPTAGGVAASDVAAWRSAHRGA